MDSGSGDLTVLQNPDGALRTFTYDGDHLLTSDRFSGQVGTFAYDGSTKLLASINWGGASTVTFDAAAEYGLTCPFGELPSCLAWYLRGFPWRGVAMAAKGRDSRRERFWRRAMAQQRSSGLGVRAYCREHGLAETSFHYWRRELGRRDAEPRRPAVAAAALAPRVPRKGLARRRNTSAASMSSPTFVPVTVIPAAAIEVRCPSGHVVSLPAASLATTDGEALRRFFVALTPEPPAERRPPC